MITDIFQQWLPLHRLAIADLPQYGDFPAVYALRDATTKEILKFGNPDRLRRRISGNYLGGVGGSTTQRIHGELFGRNMIDRVELAWLKAKDKAEAERKEKEFRVARKTATEQRPAWDRQG
jgi:hypothetical protein